MTERRPLAASASGQGAVPSPRPLIGHPPSGMSAHEIATKVLNNVGPVLGSAEAGHLLNQLNNLESEPRVSALFRSATRCANGP